MERHSAMIQQNHTDGCLPFQNCPARKSQIWLRYKVTGDPTPAKCRQRIPCRTQYLFGMLSPPRYLSPPSMPPASPGPIQSPQRSQFDKLPAANADSPVPLSQTQPVNLNALAADSLNNDHFDAELLPNKRISCSEYTICCVWMRLKYIVNMGAANWTYMSVEISIDWKERDFVYNIMHNLRRL